MTQRSKTSSRKLGNKQAPCGAPEDAHPCVGDVPLYEHMRRETANKPTGRLPAQGAGKGSSRTRGAGGRHTHARWGQSPPAGRDTPQAGPATGVVTGGPGGHALGVWMAQQGWAVCGQESRLHTAEEAKAHRLAPGRTHILEPPRTAAQMGGPLLSEGRPSVQRPGTCGSQGLEKPPCSRPVWVTLSTPGTPAC